MSGAFWKASCPADANLQDRLLETAACETFFTYLCLGGTPTGRYLFSPHPGLHPIQHGSGINYEPLVLLKPTILKRECTPEHCVSGILILGVWFSCGWLGFRIYGSQYVPFIHISCLMVGIVVGMNLRIVFENQH